MPRSALLLALVPAVAVTVAPEARAAAGEGDFDERAGRLLHKKYFFHPWREADHTVDGEDWSLPPWVKAAPYSGISIDKRKLGADFPGRIQRSVRASWREVEPREGEYDFSALRKRILDASANGKHAVKMGLCASVWETRYFVGLQDRTVRRTTPGTAPTWMKRHGVGLVEERPNRSIPFQVVNMDIYHPEYHGRYVKLVRELGRSGIPRMKELDLCYLHLKSASRGEEGSGPKPGDPKRRFYEERLRAWAEAFQYDRAAPSEPPSLPRMPAEGLAGSRRSRRTVVTEGVEFKLCNVSHREPDMELGLSLGMGQRNGFVEHYMLHVPNPMLGQLLDKDGYLVVDEKNPLIAENRASGDENEEYTRAHETRFGPVETFPHRYRESMLRVLQMRRNFVWAEGGPWLVNPPLLHYVALELGKNARTAPDAWCYLRETQVPDRANRNWRKAVPAKNFERWLYQRDAPGARAEPAERVDVPKQMFEFHKQHLYDHTARRTRSAEGEKAIRFAADESFLEGGPHEVAVKVTYLDRGDAEWALEYFVSRDEAAARNVKCADTGKARTVTFILRDAFFPGRGYAGRDLQVRAVRGDAIIRFVRLIKLDPRAVAAPRPGAEGLPLDARRAPLYRLGMARVARPVVPGPPPGVTQRAKSTIAE